MATTWTPTIDRLEPAQNPHRFLDLEPLLERLVDAYGKAAVGAMLGVDKSTITRWTQRERTVSPEMRMRIIELSDVIVRMHQVFNPSIASRWLVGHEPLLGDARPIDVLAMRGAAPIIDALDAIAAGGFA
jgi:putative toxin-antitoxin system antitoxin component (TIGR02293 family)